MPKTRIQSVQVEYAGEEIPVALEFKARKRLSITVHPDRSVTALAPAERSIEEVMVYLKRRRAWIVRQRRHFEKYQPLPTEKRYISGETHLHLGRQYTLRVCQNSEERVKLVGPCLRVYTPFPQKSQEIRKVLNTWYRSHAQAIFEDRLHRCLALSPSLRAMNPTLRIRIMKNRWGSCSKSGTITLNLELIKVSSYCLEYVIMHEVCHLRHHDHSDDFFRLLGRCMPDWQERKDRLNGIVLPLAT
jgi:predicted metal-dependent hydrolase